MVNLATNEKKESNVKKTLLRWETRVKLIHRPDIYERSVVKGLKCMMTESECVKSEDKFCERKMKKNKMKKKKWGERQE